MRFGKKTNVLVSGSALERMDGWMWSADLEFMAGFCCLLFSYLDLFLALGHGCLYLIRDVLLLARRLIFHLTQHLVVLSVITIGFLLEKKKKK